MTTSFSDRKAENLASIKNPVLYIFNTARSTWFRTVHKDQI